MIQLHNGKDNALEAADRSKEKNAVSATVTAASGRSIAKIARPAGRIALYLSRVALYGVFLVGVTVLILVSLEAMARFSLSKSPLGPVYGHDMALARLDTTRPVSHYDYDFNPGVCVEQNTFKGNRYEYSNNAGFREPNDIAMDKPADEFRVFLTGGSTAFGLGATGQAAAITGWRSIQYIETISHMMEMILNNSCPIQGKKIRVYNTAVWGHAYQHNLLRYLTKLRQYHPDLVVSLDGANEIPLISNLSKDWNYFQQGQYGSIIDQIFSYDSVGLSSYLTLWLKNNTYLMARLWLGRDTLQAVSNSMRMGGRAVENSGEARPSNETLGEYSTRIDSNVETVVRMVENYHSVLKNDGTPHIFALQPWLYLSKKPMTDTEKQIAEMELSKDYYGVPSDKVYALFLRKTLESAQKHGYAVVDFSDYFDDVSEWVFTDWCHLTAGANYLIARELSNVVKRHIFGRALTELDRLETKNSYFYDVAASASVHYAPPPEDTANGPKNALSGYPSYLVYESKEVARSEKLEMVLKLAYPSPIGRMRLVWADKEAVPEKWAVEVSQNGREWQEFVRGTNESPDNYSQWPGFEYYAAKPVMAAYVRYRPLDMAHRSIKLRAWSIYR